MSGIVRSIINFLITALPISLSAWTCVCGHTEEGKNPILERIFYNFLDCRIGTTESNHVRFYTPPFTFSEGGQVDWWIDERHKRSACGNFYLKYELVHRRLDSRDRYSIFQVFDFLNYNDQIKAYNELIFDANWVYTSNIDYEHRKIIEDEEKLSKEISRAEQIDAENRIYKGSMYIPFLQKNYKDKLKTIYDMQKENNRLMLQIYDNCLKTHLSLIAQYQIGILKFLEGDFQGAFNSLKEFSISLIKKQIQLISDNATALLCGIVASEVEEYALAESCLNCALEKASDCKEAYLERAIARFELGDLDRALEDYISSGLHTIFLGIQSQFKEKRTLADGVARGFNDTHDINENDTALLANFLTDLVDAKIKYSTEGVKPSLDLLTAIVECLEDARQKDINKIAKIQPPELVYLIQNSGTLNDFEKGRLIGIAIKKYGVEIFSKISGLQSVDFYRSVKKVGRLLKLADLLDSKTDPFKT